MQLEKNILPLNIVKGEIDENLAKSEALLEAFDDNRSEVGKLNECIENFNQLKGVFELIQLKGASLLVEAMSQVCELSIGQSDEERDQSLSKVSSAIVLLMRYLEYVQINQTGLPELLFANINELRALLKEKPLTESYFFELDLKAFDLTQIKSVSDVDAKTRRLRHMYQVGLLGTFKEENLKSNFKMMSRALQRLNSTYEDAHGSPLLRICNGALEALVSGNITLTKPRKMLLGRIDRQIKQLLNPETSEFDEAAIVTLVKDCLYLITLAEPNTELIKSIQEEFSLDKFEMNEALIQQERELMTGPGAAVIKTVSSALREEIASIKDALDVMARAGDKLDELKALSEELRKISHTLVMLGLSTSSDRLDELISSLESTDNFEASLQDLADSLVFVERSIARLEQNNTPIQANTTEENPEQLLELDHVASSVVKETRKILAMVQNAINGFISNDFSVGYLENTVESLHSAWGGILFINIERAAEQLRQSERFIAEKLLGEETVKDEEKMHTLADALASIDYYLEGIEEKKPLGEGALDIAEESLQELGFGSAA